MKEIIDDKTDNLGLPLPFTDNPLNIDVGRIAEAFKILDQQLTEAKEEIAKLKQFLPEATLSQGGGLNVNSNGKLGLDDNVARYEIGEIKYFLHPDARPGWYSCTGGIIYNVDKVYPLAYKYFQTAQGQRMCTDETSWNNLRARTWSTGGAWGGIGGAPKFVFNASAKTLRVPDLRGCVPETPGGTNSPAVGDAQGDGIRNITGYLQEDLCHVNGNGIVHGAYDAFYIENIPNTSWASYEPVVNGGMNGKRIRFNANRMVPCFSVNRMKSYGVLTCVWLGLPQA